MLGECTFHDWVGFEYLLFNPRVLTTDCRQKLQDQFGTFCLSGSRLATYSRNKGHGYHVMAGHQKNTKFN